MSLTITPDIHKTFLSQQAEEFRTKYAIGNSTDRPHRTKQKDLILEEFKEFLEAEGMLFRKNKAFRAECLKELGDLV